MTDEPRVRDIWKTLPRREVVGHGLVRRVGGRGWARPRFARFVRFFERCGLPNPWDPDAPEVEVGLGEVGIAQRRQPAPHAAPPAPASSGPKIPNLPPGAPKPKPVEAAAAAEPSGRIAPRIGEQRRDDTEILRKKMEEKERAKVDPARRNPFKVNQPLAKIPTRPGMEGEGSAPSPVPVRSRAAAMAPARPAAAPTRPSTTPGVKGPARVSFEPSRRPVLPDGPEELDDEPGSFFSPGMRRPEPPPPPPMAPRVEEGAPASQPVGASVGGAPPQVMPPPVKPAAPPSATPVPPAKPAPPPSTAPSAPARPAPPPSTTQSAPARPAPPPSTTQSAPPRPAAPVASAPPRPAAPAASAPPRPAAPAASAPPRPMAPPSAAPASPPKPAAPVQRTAKPAGSGGLDDMFGMGSGADTRIRLGAKPADGEAPKPRRPMVSNPDDLARQGLDRRPPPPKPPQVTPTSAPAPSGGAKDDLPDE